MSKGLIAFVLVAAILAAVVIVFMSRSAFEAQQKSDRIIEDFKKVDESLKRSTFTIDSANKTLLDSADAKLNR